MTILLFLYRLSALTIVISPIVINMLLVGSVIMSFIIVPIISILFSAVFIYFDASIRVTAATLSSNTQAVIRQTLPTKVAKESQSAVRSSHSFNCLFKHCQH